MDGRWETHPVYVEPYKYKVHIMIGEKEWSSFCEKVGVHHDVLGVDGLVWPLEQEDGATFAAFYLRGSKVSVGAVVHECVHIVHEVMEDRGVPITYENTEVIAYHVEHLFNQIMRELKIRKVSLQLT